jgi:hypothetical protein
VNYGILTGHQTEYNTNPPLRFAQRKGSKRKSDGDISYWTHVREMIAWQRVSGLPRAVGRKCLVAECRGSFHGCTYGRQLRRGGIALVWSGIVTHGDRDRYSG